MFSERIAIDILHKTNGCLWLGDKPVFNYGTKINFGLENLIIKQNFKSIVLLEKPIDMYSKWKHFLELIIDILEPNGYLLIKTTLFNKKNHFHTKNLKTIYKGYDMRGHYIFLLQKTSSNTRQIVDFKQPKFRQKVYYLYCIFKIIFKRYEF